MFGPEAGWMAAIVSRGLNIIQFYLDSVEAGLLCSRISSSTTGEEDIFGDCTSRTRMLAFCSMRKEQNLDSPLRTSDFTFGEIRKRVAEVAKGCEHGCGNCQCDLMPKLRELCEQVEKVIDHVGQRLIEEFEACDICGQSMI
ncbi:unnamed protein product [Parascedosporium putredinis]|uniref:Uncharacterized protein n=1 Tax=Parascedosporium putredinis TaxID=1442378 RepID=A0A9P1MB27_9PEZI|nr:unnamed protein product [Parascedosporium putredinis]CAI7993804.1 unnamed protein product [Parascedosporium putredinis]